MAYFGGAIFGSHDHVPACSAWIDARFPHFYALNYAQSGRIHWALDDRRLVILNAPVAWWTSKGNTTRYRYGRIGAETWDHYYVTFDGARAAKLFRQCLGPSRTRRPYAFIADSEQFRRRWERLFSVLGQAGTARDAWALHELEGIVLQICQPPPTRPKAVLEIKIDGLRMEMQARPGQVWDWKREAVRLGLSVVHLRRSFRKLTGLPPHQYLLKARMDAAASQLRTTTTALKEIAEAVGVPDVYHFCKQFKARFYLPPATYRKEMSNLYGRA